MLNIFNDMIRSILSSQKPNYSDSRRCSGIIQQYTVSLFPSDLFIQPGNNKPVISDDLSKAMIHLYRATGIFASEGPVKRTTKRLIDLSPTMVYPMHGLCIDNSMFSKYTDTIMKNNFAYSGMLLGQQLDTVS